MTVENVVCLLHRFHTTASRGRIAVLDSVTGWALCWTQVWSIQVNIWLEWRRREQTNRSTVMCSCAKKIVPLKLHVCMPFSAHFYVLLLQFTLSLYFAVSLITNMLFSIHLMLVSANFTHATMAERALRDQWPMHSYAQLLSKLLPSPQNGSGVQENKNAMNCFTRT